MTRVGTQRHRNKKNNKNTYVYLTEVYSYNVYLNLSPLCGAESIKRIKDIYITG